MNAQKQNNDNRRMSAMVAKRCDVVDEVFYELMGSVNGDHCKAVRQSWLTHGPRANRFDGITVYIRLLSESIPSESTRQYFLDAARERYQTYELSLTQPGLRRAQEKKNAHSNNSRWFHFFHSGDTDTPHRPSVEVDETIREFVNGAQLMDDTGGRQ